MVSGRASLLPEVSRKGSEVFGKFRCSQNLCLAWVRTKLYTQWYSLFPPFLTSQRFQEMMFPLRKHTLAGALPPGPWCFSKFQTLKDFYEYALCLLHKHLEASVPSAGSSGYGCTGPCCTLKLFHIAGLMLQDPDSPVWNPETLFRMQHASKKTLQVIQQHFSVIQGKFSGALLLSPHSPRAGMLPLALQPGWVHTAGMESRQKGPSLPVSLG